MGLDSPDFYTDCKNFTHIRQATWNQVAGRGLESTDLDLACFLINWSSEILTTNACLNENHSIYCLNEH